MPHTVGSDSATWGPAHWLGRFLRGGVDAVGAEAEFLQSRMRGRRQKNELHGCNAF